jgi:glucokinase
MIIACIEHGGTEAYLQICEYDEKNHESTIKESISLTGKLPDFKTGWKPIKGFPEDTIDIIYEKIKNLGYEGKIDAIGYSIAGPVTLDGVVVRATNIWGDAALNVPYQKMIEEYFKLCGKVAVVNDMTAAGMGFIRFAQGYKEKENFCIITVSTGVGSKNFLNGKVQLGADGLAGEIGHTPILHPEELIPGRICGCGGIYCLEAGASGDSNALRAHFEAMEALKSGAFPDSFSLIQDISRIDVSPGTSYSENLKKINILINKASRIGSSFALYVLNKSIRPLARAIAATEVQYNPGKFYIIGGFALNIERFLDILKLHLIGLGIMDRSREQIEKMVELVPVERAVALPRLKESLKSPGLQGALAAALEKLFPKRLGCV